MQFERLIRWLHRTLMESMEFLIKFVLRVSLADGIFGFVLIPLGLC